MVSKKQLNKFKKLNIDIEKQQIEANNQLGILAKANQEILKTAEKLQGKIIESSKEKTDIYYSAPLPEGTGLNWSTSFLTSAGCDTSKISLEDLLSDDKIIAIKAEINRPLVDRLKWDKWDYIFVFGAAIAGSTADFMWGDPRQGLSKYLSDKNTIVGERFEKIHSMHRSGSPMDYQTSNMGGGNHRINSIGHDLFGFIEGIWQIKNGTFTGGYFSKDNKWISIVTEFNQYNNAYDKLSSIEAIIHYTIHVFCDFFSSKSLPVPGFGYLARMSNKEIREFAKEIYGKGYNLRHTFLQSIGVGIIEVIIRVYAHLRYSKMEIPIESFKLKKNEMSLLTHSIVTGVNIGKVVITKNPLLLNLPQVLFTCYKFWPFVINHYRHNNRIQIKKRNLDEISNESELKYIDSLSDVLSSKDFGYFLHQKPILL